MNKGRKGGERERKVDARKGGWKSRDSCTMSRVTSCRLLRVFSFPFARLSLSLFCLPPSTTATSLPTCPHNPYRVLLLSRTRFVSSVEQISTRIERGAKYIVDTQQPLIARQPPPYLNVILYDLFDFASRNSRAFRLPCRLRSSSSASTRVQSGCWNLHVAEVTFSERRETISFFPNY